MPLLSTLHELLAALLSWKCCQHSHSIISPTSYYVPATRGPSHKYAAGLQSPGHFPEYQLLFLLMFCISFEFSAPILYFFSLSHMAFYFYSAILKPMGVFRNPILTASYGRLFAKLATAFSLLSTPHWRACDFVALSIKRYNLSLFPWIWAGRVPCFAQINAWKRPSHFSV